ncbi:hypothetical protein EHN07_14530, partial [Buttiauxella warmboldiae]
TTQEKAWFFLHCGDRPKINKLILLVFWMVSVRLAKLMGFVISLKVNPFYSSGWPFWLSAHLLFITNCTNGYPRCVYG